jgi:hypothetical protein
MKNGKRFDKIDRFWIENGKRFDKIDRFWIENW